MPLSPSLSPLVPRGEKEKISGGCVKRRPASRRPDGLTIGVDRAHSDLYQRRPCSPRQQETAPLLETVLHETHADAMSPQGKELA